MTGGIFCVQYVYAGVYIKYLVVRYESGVLIPGMVLSHARDRLARACILHTCLLVRSVCRNDRVMSGKL